MHHLWPSIAQRAVEALGARSGELVEVHDLAGRADVLHELLLTIEQAGATPLPVLLPPGYLRRLLATADVAHLAAWDRHRARWIERADRVLVLQGAAPRLAGAPRAAVEAWEAATGRLNAIEEERRLPSLLLATPTAAVARRAGRPLTALEAAVLPALAVSADELRREVDRMLAAVRGGRRLTIRSATGDGLHLALGDRPWLDDDGRITADDRGRGGHVANLPAGAVYTTVVEGETRGTLWLPRAGAATEVALRFEAGRIVEVTAASGAAILARFLDRHSGEPRRVGHVGVGLNPRLGQPVGWTLVDEHAHGAVFISLGENRYLGGQNESSLNVDYAIPGATLHVDDRAVVDAGRVVV
jgi:leucyl aminopeptidase (aminopeptidase T)